MKLLGALKQPPEIETASAGSFRNLVVANEFAVCGLPWLALRRPGDQVRDPAWLHRFRDRECSCGGRWR